MKAFMLFPSTRAALAALIIAYLAVRSAQQQPEPGPGSNDAVSPVLHDFQMASPFLPATGKIGYIGPPDAVRYYLAQHILAPRVIVRGSQFEFVIVDFPRDKVSATMTAGLVPLGAVGDVAVYRRKAP
jgi:hypothetical protein